LRELQERTREERRAKERRSRQAGRHWVVGLYSAYTDTEQ